MIFFDLRVVETDAPTELSHKEGTSITRGLPSCRVPSVPDSTNVLGCQV